MLLTECGDAWCHSTIGPAIEARLPQDCQQRYCGENLYTMRHDRPPVSHLRLLWHVTQRQWPQRPTALANGRWIAGRMSASAVCTRRGRLLSVQANRPCSSHSSSVTPWAWTLAHGSGTIAWMKVAFESKACALASVDCADDGLDRPALPLLPSPADPSRPALHRDGDDRRAAPWRRAAASRFRSGRAAGGAAARRQRARGARGGGAAGRALGLRRDQPQLRLPERAGAARLVRRLPDGRARARGRLRQGDARRRQRCR